jgi:hypothetical protein
MWCSPSLIFHYNKLKLSEIEFSCEAIPGNKFTKFSKRPVEWSLDWRLVKTDFHQDLTTFLKSVRNLLACGFGLMVGSDEKNHGVRIQNPDAEFGIE